MAEVEKDDLLGDVRAAAESLEQPAEGTGSRVEASDSPAGQKVETAEEKAERVRDEQGRFAKAEEGKDKPRETLKLKEKPAEAAKSLEVAATGEQSKPLEQAKPADERIAPPPEWKGRGKTQWDKLPRGIQEELRTDHEALTELRQQMAPLEQAVAPYRDTLVRDAGSVENGIGQLMQFYKLFLENPQGLIQHIARTRGIDLGAPQGQPQPGTPAAAPDISSQIAQAVQQAIAPINQRFQQTETQQLEQTVAEFAADPRYPYFQDVKVQMGQLMQAGLARNMPEAYDKAVRLTPAIWSTLEQQRTEEAQRNQAAEAEKAKRASNASLRGSPLPNGHAGGGAGSNASVLDDVRAADAELSGA